MEDSKHILVCNFDSKSSRLSTFELHEWTHKQLQVDDEKVQIYGIKRQVFIKCNEPTYTQAVLKLTTGFVSCKHPNG
jgi:hypothetical protein